MLLLAGQAAIRLVGRLRMRQADGGGAVGVDTVAVGYRARPADRGCRGRAELDVSKVLPPQCNAICGTTILVPPTEVGGKVRDTEGAAGGVGLLVERGRAREGRQGNVLFSSHFLWRWRQMRLRCHRRSVSRDNSSNEIHGYPQLIQPQKKCSGPGSRSGSAGAVPRHDANQPDRGTD